jgi:hypothetical protein
MNDIVREIDEALAGGGPIAREKVVSWIDSVSDLPTLAKLYRLTGEHYHRIQPDLGQDAECAAVQRYLLECVRQDVKENSGIEDRWQAAQTLHRWFCHLGDMEGTSLVLGEAARAITELFLQEEDVRDAIETGFLEHALEMETLRPYFEHWSKDERLRPAWERALEWGKAHPGFLWGMFKELEKFRSNRSD